MRSVEVGGVTVGYRDSGDPDSPVVLLLHGGGSSAATWDQLTPLLLTAGYRVVTPDLRGHGASGRTAGYPLTGLRDDLLRALDALGIKDFALVGHSLGGYVGTLVAQARPARITRLVLEDPPAPAAQAGGRSGLSPLRTLLLGVTLVTGRQRRYDRRALLSPIRQLRVPDPQWWAGLATVTAPTLVISGGPTSHVSAERLRAVARALPRGEFTTVPVGHRIHSLAPVEYAEVVLPFLGPAPTGGD